MYFDKARLWAGGSDRGGDFSMVYSYWNVIVVGFLDLSLEYSSDN